MCVSKRNIANTLLYVVLLLMVLTKVSASSTKSSHAYELRSAAINSEDDLYSVATAQTTVESFTGMLICTADGQSVVSLPAISSMVEAPEPVAADDKFASFFYQASYDSANWGGNLHKSKRYSTFINGLRQDLVKTVWDAQSRLPEPAARQIFMRGESVSGLQAFTVANAPDSLQEALNQAPAGQVDQRWQERLNYLRGERSNEGEDAGGFRQRTAVLGDFLDSRPVIVTGAGYLPRIANQIEGNEKYSAFAQANKTRRAQVYVGGNAGMLHGFDAETGVETFAYVPTAVFKNLAKLTWPDYDHQYFVNGSPVVADVYDGAGWRTVLVSGLGAGGKSYFALDITHPDDIKLLWEKTATDFDSVSLGYSIPQPTVARLHSGRWAVVLTTGYANMDHNNGKAALLLVDAITGELIKSLEVVSDVESTGWYGLSTPRLADYDGDGVADYAYAGDLHGNLWRFDLLGSGASPERDPAAGAIFGDKNSINTAGFRVSYGGKPMLQAKGADGSPQAITVPPSIVRHASRTGYIVIVGTGQQLSSAGKRGANERAESVYGIWDQRTRAETSEVATIQRSQLARQTFTQQVTARNEQAGVEREARTLSNNAVNWDTSKGWVLDLQVPGVALQGEMLVNEMQVVGQTLLLATQASSNDPCDHQSSNWLYAIDPETGGRIERHVFETRYPNGDLQSPLSGIQFGMPGGIALDYGASGLSVPGLDGDVESIHNVLMTGRKSWRLVESL